MIHRDQMLEVDILGNRNGSKTLLAYNSNTAWLAQLRELGSPPRSRLISHEIQFQPFEHKKRLRERKCAGNNNNFLLCWLKMKSVRKNKQTSRVKSPERKWLGLSIMARLKDAQRRHSASIYEIVVSGWKRQPIKIAPYSDVDKRWPYGGAKHLLDR